MVKERSIESQEYPLREALVDPAVIDKLNRLLGAGFVIYIKTLNYHWNIEGPLFHSLHEFLEENYKMMISKLDALAERIRILGFRPASTLAELKKLSEIQERPGHFPSAEKMLSDLLGDHDSFCEDVRSVIDTSELDVGTEDLLIEILRQHEKIAWKLNAQLTSESSKSPQAWTN